MFNHLISDSKLGHSGSEQNEIEMSGVQSSYWTSAPVCGRPAALFVSTKCLKILQKPSSAAMTEPRVGPRCDQQRAAKHRLNRDVLRRR